MSQKAHMTVSLELVDDIMDSLTVNKFGENVQMSDPMIQTESKKLDALLDNLEGSLSKAYCENIRDKVVDLVNAYSAAAILYGIRVAEAIQDVTANPGTLSQYVMDRVAAQNGNK